MTRLKTIREQLGGDSGVKPGSGAERELLEEARALREHETDEFAIVHGAALRAVADKNLVVNPDHAQEASIAAVEQVTAEHAAVPAAPPHPADKPQ